MVSKLCGYLQRISNFRPKTKMSDYCWMISYVLNGFKIVTEWSQMFWMIIKMYQYFQMSSNTPDISEWFQMFRFQNYQEIFRWFQVSRIFRDLFKVFSVDLKLLSRGTGLYQNFGHESFLNFIFGIIKKGQYFFSFYPGSMITL